MTSMTQEPIYRPQVYRGKVQWFNPAKGYGFIRPGTVCTCPCHEGFNGLTFERCVHCEANHAEDVIVHHSAVLMSGYRELVKGQQVEFEIVPAVRKDKRVQAHNVRVVR